VATVLTVELEAQAVAQDITPLAVELHLQRVKVMLADHRTLGQVEAVELAQLAETVLHQIQADLAVTV
jgi:hypothetical protein